MSATKPQVGHDAIVEGEATVIPVTSNLADRTKRTRTSRAPENPVQSAEAAVDRLSTGFRSWMVNDVEHLVGSWMLAAAGNFAGEPLEAFFRRAHAVRGEAATMGFPLVGAAATSLCLVLEAARDGHPASPAIVSHHVRAIRAMVAEGARTADDAVGVELVRGLEQLSQRWLAGRPQAATASVV